VERIPDMLAFCTQAKDKNDIQLRNLRSRAAVAKTANDNAIQAAIDQVQHMTTLPYDKDTQRVWRNGDHIPPEKFKWASQLQQATKSEKSLRTDTIRVKTQEFLLCSQKLKEQEHVLTLLMNRFLDYDATYDATETEYKKKKTQFDTRIKVTTTKQSLMLHYTNYRARSTTARKALSQKMHRFSNAIQPRRRQSLKVTSCCR
jgi:predicted porin